MLYLVKRIHYPDDDLCSVLQLEARCEQTTVSEIERRIVRDWWREKCQRRAKAMEAVVGIRKDRTDIGDSTEYIRRLRRDKRLERLMKQWRRP